MKSPNIEQFLNHFTQTIFGREQDGKLCVTCGSDEVGPRDFRDDLSWREFGISFMCQRCQDEVFE